MAKQQQPLSELEQLKKEVKKLKSENRHLLAINEDLLKDSKSNIISIDSLEKENLQLISEKEDLENKLIHMANANKANADEVLRLNNLYSQYSIGVQSPIESQKKTIDKLEADLKRKEAECEEFNDTASELRKKAHDLKIECKNHVAKIEKFRSTITENNKIIFELNEELATEKKSVHELKTSIKKMSKSYSSALKNTVQSFLLIDSETTTVKK